MATARSYAHGKVFIDADTPVEFNETVARVLAEVIDAVATIDRDRLRERLIRLGVPQDVVEAVVASARITEDAVYFNEIR